MTTLNTLSKESIGKLTLKQADEALTERQKELGEVFKEANDGSGTYDFNKVTCLGANVKGSVAVAALVNGANEEMNALGEHIDLLRGAEKAAKDHEDRLKARRNVPLPGAGGQSSDGAYQQAVFKSLGQLVAETKDYQDWAAQGAGGGKTLQFDEMYLSDMLASGMFTTIGAKALMTRAAGYGPEVLRAPGFVDAITRPIQILDIIPMGRTGQAAYKYMEETTRTHGAAATAEGAAAAESTFIFTEKSSPVEKITDSIPVTDEQLEDVDGIQSYIDGRLTFGIRQKFDQLALTGDGTAPNLRGLKNVVGIQTQAKGADPAPDAFFKAMTKIRQNGRSIPTHHIMHSTDWQNIRLLRTADGVYIWGSPAEAGPERMWGLSVVQQEVDVAGRGYTGSFNPDCVSGFEKKGVDIQVGYVGTQFVEGKRTIKGDARMALVWFRPPAFCEVTGL